MSTPAPETRDPAADDIDPLALALFGIRDHVRHHFDCSAKRGIGGHHFDAADECALADIVRRYGDDRVEEASSAGDVPPGRVEGRQREAEYRVYETLCDSALLGDATVEQVSSLAHAIYVRAVGETEGEPA